MVTEFLFLKDRKKLSCNSFMLHIVAQIKQKEEPKSSFSGLSVHLLVHKCIICRLLLASQGREPIIPGTTAKGPMTDLGTDLFQIGYIYYLVMVDRYSNFHFVYKLSKLHTSSITKVLSDWFNTFGWPDRPYNPQNNGLSESAVKQMKFLLEKTNENFSVFSSSLLEFSNTHNVPGKSPAQMLFERCLRGKLPHLPRSNNFDIANVKARADHHKQ